MFNVTVLRIKDLIKYFILIIIAIIMIFILVKFVSKNKDSLTNENVVNDETKEETSNTAKKGLFSIDLISCLGNSSIIMQENALNDENSDITEDNSKSIKAYKEDFFEDILKSQIGSIENFDKNSKKSDLKNTNDNEETNNNQAIQNDGQTEQIQLASTGLSTEVVTPNPIPLSYNTEYGNIKIKNQTSHELTEEMLNPDITIENKNVIIFHTHTCESYTPSEKYNYEETGNFRTTDLNYTVARVGDELEKQLTQYNYNVIHDKTYHDYPEYNGAYTRSLETEENILNANPSDIIFDLHRDAIGSRSDYAPTVKIGEDECAQIMFVMGSDEGGLWHPNWLQNLKFAVKVQSKAEEMYPGLFKPLMLTKYRYNQHAGKYASIIEVGATGNTLEQCNNSMKYFAKVLDEVMK